MMAEQAMAESQRLREAHFIPMVIDVLVLELLVPIVAEHIFWIV